VRLVEGRIIVEEIFMKRSVSEGRMLLLLEGERERDYEHRIHEEMTQQPDKSVISAIAEDDHRRRDVGVRGNE
jgi:hypothetical protein